MDQPTAASHKHPPRSLATILDAVRASTPASRPHFDRDYGPATTHPLDPRNDDDLDALSEDRDPRPSPKPLVDAAAVIAQCEKDAKAYCERVRGDKLVELQALIGMLRVSLTSTALIAEMVRTELQTAVDDGVCNSYVDAGHLARVVAQFGIHADEYEVAHG